MIKTYDKLHISQLFSDITKFYDKVPEGKLDISRHDPKRTSGQQSKIHAIMRKIALHAGCGEELFKQEIIKRNAVGIFPHWPHDIQEKGHFGNKETMEANELIGIVPKSESKLTKKEESEMIEHLYALGAEWGVTWDE